MTTRKQYEDTGGTGSADNGDLLSPAAAINAVRAEVASWKGITTHEGHFGEIEFWLGRRQLGHVHGSLADLPFPRRIRDVLIAARRARPHHVLPDSGWVTAPMRTTIEVAGVIELFRQNYERALISHADANSIDQGDGKSGE